MTEAVVLAGGLGTRLRSVVPGLPKPMADVGGRPFLAFVLDHLAAGGVSRAVLSVGYMHETISACFGDCHGELSIVYSIEGQPQGTGGGLRDALRMTSGSDTLALNGDTFFGLDIRAMREAHLASGAALTIALRPMRDFDRYGAVRVEGGRVVGFEEKARRAEGLVNGGVYVIGRAAAEALQEVSGAFSFEEFLERRAVEFDARAFVSDAYFIDIGVPEDYARACREMPSMGRTLQ